VDCASRVGLVCGRRERCWKAARLGAVLGHQPKLADSPIPMS
jgi:hypothetical protein